MNRVWDPRGGPDPDTKTPRFRLPPGACDAHVHVFGPRSKFPFLPRFDQKAFDAPKEDLEAMHAVIGADRCVIVHGATHGPDMSATLDAMATGGGRYRAVAQIDDTITDAQLEAYHAAGVRGVRVNIVSHLGGPPDAAVIWRLADRIAPLGWHLCIHMRDDDIVKYADLFRGLSSSLLIDHMARINPVDRTSAPYRTLVSLLESEDAWVKIAALEKVTHEHYPFADICDVAASLIETFPDRVIWGTDWPHPDIGPQGPTNDGDLVDLIPLYAPDAETQQRLLVDNPARLYGFP